MTATSSTSLGNVSHIIAATALAILRAGPDGSYALHLDEEGNLQAVPASRIEAYEATVAKPGFVGLASHTTDPEALAKRLHKHLRP